MVKTLEIAMSKAVALPEAAREQLWGIGELDAGLGEELDGEELVRPFHKEHAAGTATSAGASA
jgi:hypothetical protein